MSAGPVPNPIREELELAILRIDKSLKDLELRQSRRKQWQPYAIVFLTSFLTWLFTCQSMTAELAVERAKLAELQSAQAELEDKNGALEQRLDERTKLMRQLETRAVAADLIERDMIRKANAIVQAGGDLGLFASQLDALSAPYEGIAIAELDHVRQDLMLLTAYRRNEFSTLMAFSQDLEQSDKAEYALRLAGAMRIRQQRYTDAVAVLSPAVERFPHSEQLLISLASAHFNSGSFSEALAIARRAVHIRSSDALYASDLAEVLGALGQFEEAITLFRKSIDLDPKLVKPYIGLGHVYQNLGRHADALAVLSEAAQLRTGDWRVLNNIAWNYYKSGMLEQANDYGEYAVMAAFDQAPAHHTLAEIKGARGDQARACFHAAIAVKLDPGNEEFRETLDALESPTESIK